MTSDMADALQAIRENTDAVTRLANATMQLVQYMAEADGDEEAGPATYMDGTPVIGYQPNNGALGPAPGDE